jgi:hypothetical protein
MKKKRFAFYALFLIAGGLSAQSHGDAVGGNASGSGGSISYSIGQIDYITSTGSGGIVTQGVQQPYEIFKISTGIPDYPDISLNAVVFPNPTSDFVKLQISNDAHASLNYEMLDLNGRQIEQKAITENTTQINMASLRNGIYFLKVFGSTGIIKTFKIVKTI